MRITRIPILFLILLLCHAFPALSAELPDGSYQVSQLGPPNISSSLIRPQQRKMPVNWFRKPFGQMRKEIMTREIKTTQGRVTSIRIPPNVSPMSRNLNFSSYALAVEMGIRRQRSLVDPNAALRLTSWFYLRRLERERKQWWEANIRSVIIRGMVFQPRFEGVIDADVNLSQFSEPPVDQLRQSILGRSSSPTVVTVPSSPPPVTTSNSPDSSFVPSLPEDLSPPPVPAKTAPVKKEETSPSTGEFKKDIFPSPSGDIGPRRQKHRSKSPPPGNLFQNMGF